MDLSNARVNMIEQQLKPWEILDSKVLSVLASIPREQFVPAAYTTLAYADTEIPLPHGQHMLAPKIVGRILQALELTGIESVLEIGTGSGYLTAALAKLCNHVTTIELYRDLSDTAKVNLQACKVKNVTMHTLNGITALDNAFKTKFKPEFKQGFNTEFQSNGIFDIIVVTGSIPKLPKQLLQHTVHGGKIFAIIGKRPVMHATLYIKLNADHCLQHRLFETVVDQLEGLPLEATFTF